MGRSSYPAGLDSPSKQLMLDLTRDLEQLRVHNSELKRVKAYERRTFYERLDKADSELEAQHNAALDQVAARHEQVLEEAEETLRAHQRAVEEETRRKQEEARKEAERKERERLEKLREEQEAARLKVEREAAQKAEEEAKRRAAEEAEKKKKQEQDEKERKEKERAEEKKKREEEAQKAEQEAARLKEEEAAQKKQAMQQKQLGASRLSEDEIKVQQRYVELHQHLKKLRTWLKEQSKIYPMVKENLGGIRRTIQKCVGQLREGKGTNTKQLEDIRKALQTAANIAEPSVNIREFIAFPPEEIANSDTDKVPALMIYALNILAKSLIASLLNEASLNSGHAEPIGIVAAQIFSSAEFIYKGVHMVDILWAKYRVVCPALWGFNGNDKTEAGRRALGWKRDPSTGQHVRDQTHAERMNALGAGFAALTLRNFGRAKRRNPFPNTLFWYSMHKILTIPPSEIHETQVVLLVAMLRSSAERIACFFGHIGLALMRRAIVDLPASLPHKITGITQLTMLKDTYKRDKNILI
ncbi:hypothetical protein BDV19DRAFT_342724 [Aspergillus venezuelensis]